MIFFNKGDLCLLNYYQYLVYMVFNPNSREFKIQIHFSFCYIKITQNI